MHIAIEKENQEIVKLLLSNEDIDVNVKSILNTKYFNLILKTYFYSLRSKDFILIKFQFHIILMTFKIEYIS